MCAIIRNDEISVSKTDWGSLQWLVGSHNNTSQNMTFGRVTIKPGERNPFHSHPNCEEILFVNSGEIDHTLPKGGSVRLHKGDCIVIPAGESHFASNVGNEEAEVIVVFNSADRKTEEDSG